MPVALDIITRKKLILVRMIYQRALLQSEVLHSDFDRIMSLIAFDLANETVLKAVVAAIEPSKIADKEFQGIIQQADALLAKAGLPQVPDKVKIQHVHSLRNDAQHKAKYPNNIDVSDSRTYTRDFLLQIVSDVWGEDFESLSLTDIIKDSKVKGYLIEAETRLKNGDYTEAVVKSIAGLDWVIDLVKSHIVGSVPYLYRSVKAGYSYDKIADTNNDVAITEAFNQIQQLLMQSIIGINMPDYIRYKRITNSIASISFNQDGNYDQLVYNDTPDEKEAEFVVTFAVNTVLQIESLVGDINKPFE